MWELYWKNNAHGVGDNDIYTTAEYESKRCLRDRHRRRVR